MKAFKMQGISQYVAYNIFGVIIYISGMLLSRVNQFTAGAVLLFGAVVLYLYIVFKVAERNWLDVRAVFTGSWTGTIGLAAFRLAEYQEVWQLCTWVAMILAFLMMQIGATVGIRFGSNLYSAVQRRLQSIKLGAVSLKVQENRLFIICVITTLIGLLCFGINVAIKGFIPAFSDEVTAYRDFYTKFHVFAVAATSVSGLCFYCIKTQHLVFWKKLVLFLCMFYLTFLFPIMVVSRGVFVISALSLAVTVFYLCRKNLTALILCMVAILGIYLFVSNLRNYTADQMKVFFEPAQIEIPSQPQKQEFPEQEIPVETPQAFQLPPKAAFIYSYLTVSHDNFNESVKYLQNYTWGIRQLAPFNVLLRSDAIAETLANAEHYQVNPFLTTSNLISSFYYDFGVFGVIFFMLFWSFIFGLNQGAYEHSKNVFLLLLLGNTMTPVALGFFAPWLSDFTQWMIWGAIMLIAVASCLNIGRIEKEESAAKSE